MLCIFAPRYVPDFPSVYLSLSLKYNLRQHFMLRRQYSTKFLETKIKSYSALWSVSHTMRASAIRKCQSVVCVNRKTIIRSVISVVVIRSSHIRSVTCMDIMTMIIRGRRWCSKSRRACAYNSYYRKSCKEFFHTIPPFLIV